MTTSIGRGEDERGHGGTHEEGERSPRQEQEETKRKSCMCGPARTCGTLALVGVCGSTTKEKASSSAGFRYSSSAAWRATDSTL